MTKKKNKERKISILGIILGILLLLMTLSLQIRTLEHTSPRFLRPDAKFRTLFAKLVVAIALDDQSDCLAAVWTGQGDG